MNDLIYPCASVLELDHNFVGFERGILALELPELALQNGKPICNAAKGGVNYLQISFKLDLLARNQAIAFNGQNRLATTRVHLDLK